MISGDVEDLSACVDAEGGHFEHHIGLINLSRQFWTVFRCFYEKISDRVKKNFF